MPPTPAQVAASRRGDIESTFNAARAAREQQYTEAKVALEEDYQNDIRDIEESKRQAFLAEGLNSDGSDPRGRPQA